MDGPGHEWDGGVEPERLLDAGLQVLHLGEVLHAGGSVGVVGEDVVQFPLNSLLNLCKIKGFCNVLFLLELMVSCPSVFSFCPEKIA